MVNVVSMTVPVAAIVIKVVNIVLGLMTVISIIVSVIAGMHVLVGGTAPMAGLTRSVPPSPLTLPRPHTHVNGCGESHTRFNHIWWHMTGISVYQER